jgi:hypothetical protein
MIGDSFKDHTAFPIAAFVQPLPSKRAILPRPMHAIDATKHPRKSSCCILCKDSGCVFFSWLSQIGWTKHYDNCPTKLEDTIDIHKYRGSCVAFSISKSVEPNEELKVG